MTHESAAKVQGKPLHQGGSHPLVPLMKEPVRLEQRRPLEVRLRPWLFENATEKRTTDWTNE